MYKVYRGGSLAFETGQENALTIAVASALRSILAECKEVDFTRHRKGLELSEFTLGVVRETDCNLFETEINILFWVEVEITGSEKLLLKTFNAREHFETYTDIVEEDVELLLLDILTDLAWVLERY